MGSRNCFLKAGAYLTGGGVNGENAAIIVFLYSSQSLIISNRKSQAAQSLGSVTELRTVVGYIVMLRARMFRSLIPVLMIKERNIRARNITI